MKKKIKNDDYDYLFSIIILGDSLVGKTSVTRRYIKNSFSEEHELVIGFSMEKKYIVKDNKLIKLLIIDKFNPSERFAPLPKKYFKGKEGAIIVYDSNAPFFGNTYDNIKENIELIKTNADLDTKIILFENKCDLEKNIEIEEKIIKLANKYGIKHFEVSAKTGYNINEGFNSLIDEMIEQENIESTKNNIKLNNKAHKGEKNKKCSK